jgi:hypothetical protein
MTLERWGQISELYHATGKGGVGVLSDADTDMRQQLEWLLDQDSAGKILDGSPEDLSRLTALTLGIHSVVGTELKASWASVEWARSIAPRARISTGEWP